ncbi:MAG: glycosyltransferase family 2 protein [Sandaracinaceae bacterium]|nr:glycosyltransferase family 2 protein [Sandaracinaceae bacterium]
MSVVPAPSSVRELTIPRDAPRAGDAAGALEAAREGPRVAVIIPCYKVERSIIGVVSSIGDWAWGIYCVDDACPSGSGKLVEASFADDARVKVVMRERNGGVGAATMAGYRAAIADGADILVKVDGDGQMDPRLVPQLVAPIVEGEADYVKGNRFFSAETVHRMPWTRLVGNAGLSFLTKLSTGYWDLFDPTNGFTALEANVARELPFDKIHPRYFFETDLLFRLGVLRARVVELPADAVYADEKSNLSELHALTTFPFLHLRNLLKRIAYSYFLRNFSVASLNLVAGCALFAFGVVFGAWRWATAIETESVSTAGTVMLAALPVLLGLQLGLSFLQHDVSMVPKVALHRRLGAVRVMRAREVERDP